MAKLLGVIVTPQIRQYTIQPSTDLALLLFSKSMTVQLERWEILNQNIYNQRNVQICIDYYLQRIKTYWNKDKSKNDDICMLLSFF